MTDKKEEIDRALKEKLAPKQFIKHPINGTKFTLLVSSAKGGVGKSTVAVNLAFALQNLEGKKTCCMKFPKIKGINEEAGNST